MRFTWFWIGLAVACRLAAAQVPETGRWQELAFSTDDVHEHTEDRYLEMVVDLAARGKLDDDRVLLARVRRIGGTLIRAAIEVRPEARDWQWEIHTTSDPAVNAFCMAGGKILIGNEFVRQLKLDDAELATLIGHEIAHALAEHHREELSEARHIVPQAGTPLEVMMARLESDFSLQVRLYRLSHLQESEADHLGMILAHRAGWPAAGMVRFYEKLAADTRSSPLGGHPSPSSRLSMAKGMARLFGGSGVIQSAR